MDILLHFDRFLHLHHRCPGDEEEHFAADPAVYHASGKIQSAPLRSGGIVARLYSGNGRSRKLFARIVYGMGNHGGIVGNGRGFGLPYFVQFITSRQTD